MASGGAYGLARCLALSLALRLLASRVERFTEDSLWHERMGVREKTSAIREALNFWLLSPRHGCACSANALERSQEHLDRPQY